MVYLSAYHRKRLHRFKIVRRRASSLFKKGTEAHIQVTQTYIYIALSQPTSWGFFALPMSWLLYLVGTVIENCPAGQP